MNTIILIKAIEFFPGNRLICPSTTTHSVCQFLTAVVCFSDQSSVNCLLFNWTLSLGSRPTAASTAKWSTIFDLVLLLVLHAWLQPLVLARVNLTILHFAAGRGPVLLRLLRCQGLVYPSETKTSSTSATAKTFVVRINFSNITESEIKFWDQQMRVSIHIVV